MTRPATNSRRLSNFALSSGTKRPREKNERHLDFIRTLPCLLCGAPAEAAHIRASYIHFGKPATGAAEKPSDKYAVPLCPEHHRLGNNSQHVAGYEREWWDEHGIEPVIVAALLWSVTGDYEAGLLICESAGQVVYRATGERIGRR